MIPMIAAAHGTRSVAGLATTRSLIDLVRTACPDVDVELCFLDVLEPRLSSRLADGPGPVVVVPVLLSAGYHVLADIPSLVTRPGIVVARHLGPHPLITRALLDRLGGVPDSGSVALVGSPSSRPDAGRDLAAAAAALAAALGRPVRPLTVADSLASSLARLAPPITMVSYLLSEGHFQDALRAAAASAGAGTVTDPIGAHPAIAELIVQRYDAARG